MKFTKQILLLLFLMTASSCLWADQTTVNLDNVFSTYKVGSYLFVARYGGNLGNTTPVYVGNMTVSESQTLDISGYRDSEGGKLK
ncbi:MAG: hypothetical protein IJT09_00470 [Abditibacteriota bacterium]|nr:hypothetical protein [Abditibacteriota bacterium]